MKNTLLVLTLLLSSFFAQAQNCDNAFWGVEAIAYGDTLTVVTPFGENEPFTYLWTNGNTTNTWELLNNNPNFSSYNVTVTDAMGCTTVKQYTADNFKLDLDVFASNNELTAVASGYAPITYQWNTGETSRTISYDGQSEYCVTITDGQGRNQALCYGGNGFADVGNITLNSQADVDAFAIDYPNVTHVNGNIVVTNPPGQSDIQNLDGISQIVQLDGTLLLKRLSIPSTALSLQKADGIRLQRVGAGTDMSLLSNLNEVGALEIVLCMHLESLQGLEQLSHTGGLYVKDCNKLKNLNGLDNLTQVDGDLSINFNYKLTSLAALSNLTQVNGLLSIYADTSLVTLDGLESLTEINGALKIVGNYQLTDMSGLSNINPSSISLLRINGNHQLSVCNYDFICNFLAANLDGSLGNNSLANIKQNAPGCSAVNEIDCGSILECPPVFILHNQADVDAYLVNYPNCTELKSLFVWGQLGEITSLSNFSQITSIEENLEISGTHVTTLDGLQNITSVGGHFYLSVNDTLTSVGLNSLTHVGGAISISENKNLLNFNGLNQLSSIGGGLSVIFNPKLTEFSALSNLTQIGGNLYILSNAQLSSITGLENVHANTITQDLNPNYYPALRIMSNPNLSDCAIQSVCDFFLLNQYKFVIMYNAPGCAAYEEIHCGNGIEGFVYFDANENGHRDPFEAGLENQKVWFDVPNQNVLTKGGFFIQPAEEGTTYQLHWVDDPDWSLSSTPASYTVTFSPDNPDIYHNDFGLTPNFDSHEFNFGVAYNFPKCGNVVPFYTHIGNDGTHIESGKLVLQYNDLVQYVSATPPATEIDTINHQLSWDFTDLYPMNGLGFKVYFQMPNTVSGDTMSVGGTIFREDANGDLVEAAISGYSIPIGCSFDPNDKTVHPMGEQDEHYTLKGTPLSYLIRFQNTGTAYADKVVVTDTLDSHLDFSTFKVEDSSHPVRTTLSDEGLVTFTFDNIHLVDSTESYENSQGFVSYSVELREDAPDNTVIENTAYIVFDFNTAIQTNTTMNTMVAQIPVQTDEPHLKPTFRLNPNPASDKVQILLAKQIDYGHTSLEIADLSGKIIYTQRVNSREDLTIDLTEWARGMYLVRLVNENAAGVVGVVKLVVD